MDELRKYSHLYDPTRRDFEDAPKMLNLCTEIASQDVTYSPSSSLFQFISAQTTTFFLLHLLLLLCNSNIKFKISSSFAKSNVSQYLAIFHELRVVTAVLLGHTERPWRGQLAPQAASDALFKHKRICVV